MRTTAMILIAAAAMCVGAASGRAQEPRAEDAFQPETILALADRVYNHTLENPYTATDRNWIRATFYSGVMELYHATGNAKYREQAERWAEKHQWREGTEGSGMNKLFCVMTWAELYLLAPDAKKIEPTLQWLATDAPNSPGGAKIWFGHAPAPFDRPLYSDSLYGAPVFPMLYRATEDRAHLEMLDHVFWTVTEATLDEEDALYYRDPRFVGQKSPDGQKVLWSRGNGWVFAAFPRILRYLPGDAPGRERYVALYRRMAASLAARQQPDGFWRSNLADPAHTSMPESSGTAFFIAGYAWGVRNGVLDRETYLPVILRGWKALVGSVHPDGKLGWVQPVGDRPAPSGPHTTHEYAAGLFLSAAGEVYLLAKEGVITPEAIQAAGPYVAVPLRQAVPEALVAGALPIQEVIASGFQPSYGPENTIDGDLGTYWGAEGAGQWIRYDLGEIKPVGRVLIAWFRGDQRRQRLQVAISDNGQQWLLAFDDQLQPLWTYEIDQRWSGYGRHTAYIPAVGDLTGDGRDEVNGGYYLLNPDGTVLHRFRLNDSQNHTGMDAVYWAGADRPALLYNGGVLWHGDGRRFAEPLTPYRTTARQYNVRLMD
jgi:rhamnogalacturonyl hydrolase YesR